MCLWGKELLVEFLKLEITLVSKKPSIKKIC